MEPSATMPRDYLTDVDITDADDFQTALAELVEKADHAGVDVRGAWAFETRGSVHNWELEIIELANERIGEDE